MKWIKAIFTVISGTLMGMYGGQKNKAVRRYGIPGLVVAMDWKRGWPFLLLIPVLVMGYGENSWLMDKLGNETLMRAVYAMLLSLPFLFYGVKRWGIACVSLVIAFQVRAGSAGYAAWFGDILIEDIVRYGTLMINIAFNLFWPRKEK